MHRICKLHNPGLAQGLRSSQQRKASGHKFICSILRKMTKKKEGEKERRGHGAWVVGAELDTGNVLKPRLARPWPLSLIVFAKADGYWCFTRGLTKALRMDRGSYLGLGQGTQLLLTGPLS